jgi:tetratricopeptide (TPR) repeat protein
MSEPSTNAALDGLVARVVDEYEERVARGETPDPEEYAARHPEAATEIRGVLGMFGMAGAAAAARAAGAPDALGDFRIVREVGRGGMGIVYEAVQLSLSRRVALKVLPFAANMDPRHLQRFQNEARAAGCLHHGHIVPVYSVGCERGVHYYAMQLIEGQTLASVIRELGQQAGQRTTQATAEPATTAYQPAAGTPGSAETRACAGLSTDRSGRRGDYYRRVAQLGVQAAEALEYAHERGVIHRDIKPGNLMLDGWGSVWITDFGLAHLEHAEGSLTMSGDLVGTLRYMSPEQALGKRVPIDHRTDVYSLGVTLYELLTLRPAFRGSDRQELLRQVAFEEPIAPRKLERGIPGELETIVLKAVEKNPADRYATAGDLAADLRRWLDDRPIQARRPSLRQVAARWARRHRAVVWSAAAVLFLAAVLGGVNGLWWTQKRAAAQAEARAELREASRLQEQEKWDEALGAVRRAKGALAAVWADASLRQEIEERGKDLEMARLLQEARLAGAAVKDNHFDWGATVKGYEEAFEWYGLDVIRLDPAVTGHYIQGRSIHMQLVAALDDWSCWLKQGSKERTQVLAILHVADPDPWRERLRLALEQNDPRSLKALCTVPQGVELSLPSAVLLGRLAVETSSSQEVLTVLRQAQQRSPADFWVNHHLGWVLRQRGASHLEEAIRYFSIAVALRPRSPAALVNLGLTLSDKGQVDEAIACYHKAIALDPKGAGAHVNLGNALYGKGKVEEAIACFHKAIALDPKDANGHNSLGVALAGKGQVDEAIACYRKAIEFDPTFTEAHNNLGAALYGKGQVDEAIACYRKAIDLDPKYASAHSNLGLALEAKGQVDEAITCHRKAIELDPKDASAHGKLGSALKDKGQWDEAIACYRKAIELDPKNAQAHSNLGLALSDQGRLEEAIACHRKALALDPKYARAHNGLGIALKRQGKEEEAIACFRKAIELDPKLALAHNNLGGALYGKGQVEAAIACWRKAISLDPKYAMAHRNLGIALACKGLLDEAIVDFKKALALDPKDARAHTTLGYALYGTGKVEAAIACFRKAIALDPNLAAAHISLGNALKGKGKVEEAIACYRKAISLDPKDAMAHRNLGIALRLKKVLDKLPSILKGETEPADAAECLSLAELCQKPFQRRYADSARFYRNAFTADPKLAEGLHGHRYNAAWAAALAGCGKGTDAAEWTEPNSARLRGQAHAWLTAELTAWAERPGPDRAKVLRHWQTDANLAGVRDQAALAKLPAAERAEWQKLWSGVADLLAKSKIRNN